MVNGEAWLLLKAFIVPGTSSVPCGEIIDESGVCGVEAGRG